MASAGRNPLLATAHGNLGVGEAETTRLGVQPGRREEGEGERPRVGQREAVEEGYSMVAEEGCSLLLWAG